MAYRRIHNKGDWRHEEYVAAGTITPGMLIELVAAGTVQAHSTEGGRAERMVALEDALQGKTVADDYSADDIVTVALPAPGTVMNMLLAVGETATIGEELISAGDGTLKCLDNASSPSKVYQTIGYAMEAKTGHSVATLITVRIK